MNSPGKIEGDPMSAWDERFDTIIRQHLPFLPADEELRDDIDLMDFGLDSLGIVQLLAALEETYAVRFRDDALAVENFRTPGVLWKTLSELSA
jgi:acyl carrier protein